MNQNLDQSQTLMARQPIFDRQLKVIAYELLYRSETGMEADFLDGDKATSEVLLHAYTSICDQGSMKRVPAFINLTRDLLIRRSLPQLLRKQIVVEVLEDINVDEEVVAAVKSLKEEGYRVALDDFVYHDSYIPLLELVDIVKVDVLQLSHEELKEHVRLLSPYGVTLLAEKIESLEQLYECVDLGFKLFQGHFLSKPQVVKGKRLAGNSIALLQLVQELQDPNTTAADVEELIIKDPVLTFRLLRIVNSAAYSLVRKVESLNQAIVLLGLEQVKKWATLIAMSSNEDKPEELSRGLLTRGRMCELLAEAMGYPNVSSFFMVGMMSEIDALLDMEMDAILEKIPLNDDIKAAISRREGVMGQVLSAAMAYENGEWERLGEFEINDSLYESAYRHSLLWAQEAMQALADE
ncbi:EAL and HDOD domain-containing protein [Motiliproteus sp. SC1-56]|uniref:EAL and HDOD domain-containing protein n=1 Tax=Motiliproteus sp. SC1-56 TaxID=2799565 RepID=UPI001A905ED8|nr:HDOD domain-containing protein [Motiliproteus sp. SC1-56]